MFSFESGDVVLHTLPFSIVMNWRMRFEGYGGYSLITEDIKMLATGFATKRIDRIL